MDESFILLRNYMKKTTLTEDARVDFQTFFDEESFSAGQMTIRRDAALQNNPALETNSLLDNFLTAVKWIFLYFPGAAAIHFILMGFALSFYYGDWFVELFLGMLGIFAVAAFMIMLGVGKLFDLKYLKVVLGIFLASSLLAILYGILIAFIPGDFFGFFAKVTLPLPLLTGYFIKKDIDAEKVND